MKIKLFSSNSIKTSNVKSYVSVRVERYSFDIYDRGILNGNIQMKQIQIKDQESEILASMGIRSVVWECVDPCLFFISNSLTPLHYQHSECEIPGLASSAARRGIIQPISETKKNHTFQYYLILFHQGLQNYENTRGCAWWHSCLLVNLGF